MYLSLHLEWALLRYTKQRTFLRITTGNCTCFAACADTQGIYLYSGYEKYLYTIARILFYSHEYYTKQLDPTAINIF